MLSMFEQLAAIAKSNLDAALQFASDTAEMTERLVKSQVDAANDLLNSNNEQLQMLESKRVSAASFAYWQSAYQTHSEKVLEITGRYFADVTKIQTEIARLTIEQVTAAREKTIMRFGNFAKVAADEVETMARTTNNRVRKKRAI